ncbi:NCS1 nucleoside transporter [Dactylonectria estremocensis]|uniref:NCS1 nucleoside transporter n=1 Tax=Dactylonectria estremocensis TaxID=1079267 RepID=A0A9P9DQ06_9HYPO|nr:NCS1 nucleoside transporter [Dactylonectria estremocensis]
MAKSLVEKLKIENDSWSGCETTRWINPDIAPLPPNRRTWRVVAYLGFGSIANLCISAWTGGSSLLSLGLTVPQTVGAMIAARVLIAALVIANGWCGGEWHIGFTMSQRVVLGIYGSYIGQLLRIMLSIVWFGSQAWLGGLCVSALLSSWSHNFLTLENTLPTSANMITRDFIGFVIFQIISIPMLLIRVEKVSSPVAIANIITFFVMMGITIWACTTAGGAGPLFVSGAAQSATMERSWAWVYAIVASVGNISAGILNQSDFTRFAHKQGVQVPGMIFSLFVPGMVVPIFGILTASATMTIYGGEAYWNPLTIIHQWMLDNYSAKARAAAFFCSLGFVISQLAENTLGNGFAAGMDLAGLFPNWINIRRGGVLCALLSWAVQPWLFYNTASVFVTVAASFSVFMGPLTGIMISDYFLIRKQRIQLSQLYTGSCDGSYWYSSGFNWRAFVAWAVGFTPAMPGMISAANPDVLVSDGIYKYYLGNYLFGFLTASILYTALCMAFKVKGAGLQDDTDLYGTFSENVALEKGMSPFLPDGIHQSKLEGEDLVTV